MAASLLGGHRGLEQAEGAAGVSVGGLDDRAESAVSEHQGCLAEPALGVACSALYGARDGLVVERLQGQDAAARQQRRESDCPRAMSDDGEPLPLRELSRYLE